MSLMLVAPLEIPDLAKTFKWACRVKTLSNIIIQHSKMNPPRERECYNWVLKKIPYDINRIRNIRVLKSKSINTIHINADQGESYIYTSIVLNFNTSKIQHRLFRSAIARRVCVADPLKQTTNQHTELCVPHILHCPNSALAGDGHFPAFMYAWPSPKAP